MIAGTGLLLNPENNNNMFKFKVGRSAFFVCALLITQVSCNPIYKAGNLVALSYPITTSLRTSIVQQYVDTLISKYGYNVPNKWISLNKLVDLDSINNKRIYFSNFPEEMYLISFQGQLVISDVYNENIKRDDWVSERDSMPVNEERRIKERFSREVLNVIEMLAKKKGVPDSLIYKNK